MSCDDIELLWNDLLDRPSGASPDLERRIEAHAASCASCRATSSRYGVLRRAVAALESPPAPSAEATARLLGMMAAAQAPARRPIGRPRPRVRSRPAWIPLATAAGLLALAWIGRAGLQVPPSPAGPAVRALPEVAIARPLDSALAEARSASIELAREASAPAARIGLEMLGGDPDRGPEPAGPEGTAEAADLLQAVGERVNAGVRPISGSARHAFGFLLGPPARDSL